MGISIAAQDLSGTKKKIDAHVDSKRQSTFAASFFLNINGIQLQRVNYEFK